MTFNGVTYRCNGDTRRQGEGGENSSTPSVPEGGILRTEDLSFAERPQKVSLACRHAEHLAAFQQFEGHVEEIVVGVVEHL